MILSALDIFLGDRKVGILFQYGTIIRFQVDAAYANDSNRPILSLSMRAARPEQDAALLLNPFAAMFNSPGEQRLPPFFQNLLPEGVLRKHIAQERDCEETDHFELLAACGRNLPGNVIALPSHLSRGQVATLVTQDNDALEESVVADPLDDAVAISGMQPKLALVLEGGRYVSRTTHGDTHIIGKLPTVQYDLLPEVEFLSLGLARAAGVTVCDASLQPLSAIFSDHNYVIGKSDKFLAVQRFDRDQPGRMHVEDFAQILSVDPDRKYNGATYADMAKVMLAVDDLGERAVFELVRRITVNDLVGNYDGHLKNYGVRHLPGGRTELSPAYDIVAYSVYLGGRGHALSFAANQPKRQSVSPTVMRQFANEVGVLEPQIRRQISDVCIKALDTWPRLISNSLLQDEQKGRLTAYFMSRPIMKSLIARRART